MTHTLLRERLEILTAEFDVFDDDADIVRQIVETEPDVVGFSSFFWNVKKIITITRLVKEVMPKAVIAVGGPQGSAEPWTLLDGRTGADFVVKGEGEITFSELLCNLMFGSPALRDIAGLVYKRGDQTVETSCRALMLDLDRIPSPYLSGGITVDFTRFRGLVQTFRGCPYACAYCCWTSREVRLFSWERVKGELEVLLGKGARRVYIIDSDLSLHRKVFRPLLEWLTSLQTDTVFDCSLRIENLDQDELEMIAKAPIDVCEIGLQSTNPVALKNVDRMWQQERFEKNYFYLRDLPRRRCQIIVDLITGLPGDSYETFRETLRYTAGLWPDKINFFPLTVLPGSPLRERAGRFGLHTADDDAGTVVSTQSLPLGEMMRVARLCTAWYLVWALERLSSRGLSLLLRNLNVDRFTLIEHADAWFQQRPDIYRSIQRDIDTLNPLKNRRAFSAADNQDGRLVSACRGFVNFVTDKLDQPDTCTAVATCLALDTLFAVAQVSRPSTFGETACDT
jgi:radical SAM superfamily enzyme YgiQ (UPF0313 family)